jgi:glycosyltransferase involved in cell wall biosynthesis
MDIYVFQWPGRIGGADTRLRDLLPLLTHAGHKVTVVPNDASTLTSDIETYRAVKEAGAVFEQWGSLPDKLDGVAIACCNFDLFRQDWRVRKIKNMGLRLIWMNDMMWHDPKELEAVKAGLVDQVLFTSPFHLSRMINPFRQANQNIKIGIVENYFDPGSHDSVEREPSDVFTIGKISRHDWAKYSENFPLFYEDLGLKNPKFSVMAWGPEQTSKWKWHAFDSRWEFHKQDSMPAHKFLAKLDAFVYNSHYKFIENQSRAIVEAALSGLPIVAPNLYNFPNQIFDTRTGFLWNTYEECAAQCRWLEANPDDRLAMGRLAAKCARDVWCDGEKQMRQWERVLNG